MRAYHADGRTALSFSGGRTSAYLARQVQLANPGKEITYLFANTGKEREETLRFVQRCDEEWGLGVIWVEFRDSDAGFTLVDFVTASRQGEPFEAAIRKRRYLPNPVTRYCTVELKIRAMHRYLKSISWADGDGEWDQMVGIRADEHRRVAKAVRLLQKIEQRMYGKDVEHRFTDLIQDIDRITAQAEPTASASAVIESLTHPLCVISLRGDELQKALANDLAKIIRQYHNGDQGAKGDDKKEVR